MIIFLLGFFCYPLWQRAQHLASLHFTTREQIRTTIAQLNYYANKQ